MTVWCSSGLFSPLRIEEGKALEKCKAQINELLGKLAACEEDRATMLAERDEALRQNAELEEQLRRTEERYSKIPPEVVDQLLGIFHAPEEVAADASSENEDGSDTDSSDGHEHEVKTWQQYGGETFPVHEDDFTRQISIFDEENEPVPLTMADLAEEAQQKRLVKEGHVWLAGTLSGVALTTEHRLELTLPVEGSLRIDRLMPVVRDLARASFRAEKIRLELLRKEDHPRRHRKQIPEVGKMWSQMRKLLEGLCPTAALHEPEHCRNFRQRASAKVEALLHERRHLKQTRASLRKDAERLRSQVQVLTQRLLESRQREEFASPNRASPLASA